MDGEKCPFGLITERYTMKMLDNLFGDWMNILFMQKNFTVSEDNYETSFSPWLVKMHSKVYEPLSKFILECHQHGLTEYFTRKNDVNRIKVKKGPKIHTMYMLSAGFYIWLGTVGVACFVFVIELVVNCLKNRRNVLVSDIEEIQ